MKRVIPYKLDPVERFREVSYARRLEWIEEMIRLQAQVPRRTRRKPNRLRRNR